MPLTQAERQRRRRQKLRQDGTYTDYKAKNVLYTKRHRERTKEGLKQLSPAQQKRLRDVKKEQAKLRQRKCRQNKAANATSPIPAGDIPVQWYSGKQSLHRAVNRVWSAFPNSPMKKASVMRKLSSDFCPPITNDERGKRVDSISEELQIKVTQFYERDDISRVAPGKRDTVTVRDEGGKKKLQKRHLTMTINEAYALFKEENADQKIGRSKFAELRPPAVLLSSQTPANVCTCLYHQNMFLALESIHRVIPSNYPTVHLTSFRRNMCGFDQSHVCLENATMMHVNLKFTCTQFQRMLP